MQKIKEAILSSKGQITVPKAIREILHVENGDCLVFYIEDDEGKLHFATDETRFLTRKLGVVYATEEDNKRKANSVDKYKKMAQRHPNIFKNKFVRKIMKYETGRKFMFIFFGKKKKDKC